MGAGGPSPHDGHGRVFLGVCPDGRPAAVKAIRSELAEPGPAASGPPIGHAHFQVSIDQTGARPAGPARTMRLELQEWRKIGSWAACLMIPGQIDRGSGWRCPVAGSVRLSLSPARA